MAEVAGQVVDAPLDLLEQVWDVLVIKGQAATQQRIQDHATAPHIYLRASIQLATDHLLGGWGGGWGGGLQGVRGMPHDDDE
jgi:hypothetical protein